MHLGGYTRRGKVFYLIINSDLQINLPASLYPLKSTPGLSLLFHTRAVNKLLLPEFQYFQETASRAKQCPFISVPHSMLLHVH